MKLKRTVPIFILTALLFATLGSPAHGQPGRAALSALPAPVLKWADKGCFSSWCETGWYSSPAVSDLDGDGAAEVIGAAYSVFILDGASGTLERRIDSPGGRAWPGVVVADLEADGDLEIVTAHGEGYLHVFDQTGEIVWSRQPTPGSELRSLGVYDLEGNGDLEILVASTRSEDQWMVYEHDGSGRAGEWPQHGPDSNTNGYTAGCYNQNLAASDLDGDGRAEIVGPNDTHYIAAFEDDGRQVLANPIFGANKPWSRVGVHVDHAVDLRGYADCGIEHRPNFAHSAPIIVDVNGDGVQEAVVVGNVYNCGTSPYTSLYEIPYILKGDRTRWSGSGFDWTILPVPNGQAAPLSEDYSLIENNQPNPAAADLDGDGRLEILYPSYDGRLHAYWLDKTEHGSWPYAVTQPSEGFYRFATEPAVADLDGDGKAEVIFASWVQRGTNQTGKLHILDYLGNVLHEVALPPAYKASADWNGVLAAPTLADIDGDPDLEVVLNSAHSGFVAYDLPGTANARVLWETGRGSYQRSGSLIQGSLDASVKQVSRFTASPGDILTYTVLLRNPGPTLPEVSVTDTLPAGLVYAGNAQVSAGSFQEANGVIVWSGPVPPGEAVSIRFDARVSMDLASPQMVINTAVIDDGSGRILQRQAKTMINGYGIYLPINFR